MCTSLLTLKEIEAPEYGVMTVCAHSTYIVGFYIMIFYTFHVACVSGAEELEQGQN